MKCGHVLATIVLLQEIEDKTAYDMLRLLLSEINLQPWSLPSYHHPPTYLNVFGLSFQDAMIYVFGL